MPRQPEVFVHELEPEQAQQHGPHHKEEVRTWCAAHGIELVFTPTNASWLTNASTGARANALLGAKAW